MHNDVAAATTQVTTLDGLIVSVAVKVQDPNIGQAESVVEDIFTLVRNYLDEQEQEQEAAECPDDFVEQLHANLHAVVGR